MMHNSTSIPVHPRGFTLVETLVAIAILMIAIAGPFYSVQQAINISNTARDQLIASQLAQEGAEYVYFVRDGNYLSGSNWMTGLAECFTTNGCVVDPAPITVTACAAAGCTDKPLRLDSNTKLYTQSGSFPVTRFVRAVTLEYVPNNPSTAKQVRVTVVVTWSTNHASRSVTVTENLYNWL